MPTYEYMCLNCNSEFEKEQSIKDPPNADCPECNSSNSKRLVSGGLGFSLKGGGWAADNYSSSKKT